MAAALEALSSSTCPSWEALELNALSVFFFCRASTARPPVASKLLSGSFGGSLETSSGGDGGGVTGRIALDEIIVLQRWQIFEEKLRKKMKTKPKQL